MTPLHSIIIQHFLSLEPTVSISIGSLTTVAMKFSLAILSLAATASAFAPSAPARSVARVGGSTILAPVPVRADKT